MKSLRIIIVAAILAMLYGCRTSNTPSAPSYDGSSLRERYDALAASCGAWDQLNIPVTVSLNQPISLSASGRAYMRNGQDLYITLKVLGFEVANLYANSDSIYATDKVNRRYIAEPISSLMQGAAITIADLQDLILGRPFVNNKGTISSATFSSVNLTEEKNSWSIRPKSKVAGASYSFSINSESNAPEALEVEYSGHKVTCSYTGPAYTEKGLFLTNARIATDLKGKRLDCGLRWNWRNASWRVDPSVKWRRPSGYTRVQAAQLLQMFGR